MNPIIDHVVTNEKNIISDWNYFDNIYVIAIPQSNKIQIKRNLAKGGVGSFDIVSFQPARKTYNSPLLRNSVFSKFYGPLLSIYDLIELLSFCDSTCKNIFHNHLALIQKSYDKNYKKILIFEDDVDFEKKPSKKLIKKVVSWLDNHNWDVFYFGYCQWPYLFSVPVGKNIVKIHSPMGQHAYALSRSGMKKILDYTKQKLDTLSIDILVGNPIPYLRKFNRTMAIDILMGKIIPNLGKYAIFPAICFQLTDPAVHENAFKMLPFYTSFRKFSKSVEIISLIIPLILIVFILIILKNKIQ